MLTRVESLCSRNMIYLSHHEVKHLIFGYFPDMWWFITILAIYFTYLMWFWALIIWNWTFFRWETECGNHRHDLFMSITSCCSWSAMSSFNTTHCNVIVRSFLISRSMYRTTDHVSDISAHLLITPDRLNTSNPEFSSSPCLGHQNHDF